MYPKYLLCAAQVLTDSVNLGLFFPYVSNYRAIRTVYDLGDAVSRGLGVAWYTIPHRAAMDTIMMVKKQPSLV
jgi:hypothetical protein